MGSEHFHPNLNNSGESSEGMGLNVTLLFDNNPQTLWVFDQETLQFLAVNPAAVDHYGYSREEFLAMTIVDLRPPEQQPMIREAVRRAPDGYVPAGIWRHRLKGGREIEASIAWHSIVFEGRRARLAMVTDVTEQQMLQAELAGRSRYHERQHEALSSVVQDPLLQSGDDRAALRKVTETAAHTLEVERVSVWRFINEPRAIVSRDLYEASKGCHSSGVELSAEQFPSYFRALAQNKVIAADDALADPRTKEFAEIYLKPMGITSMLDAPIFVHGKLEGVLCIENVGPARTWRHSERGFALSIANVVSLLIIQQERAQSEARARAIVDSEPECVKVVSIEGLLLEMNPAGLRMIEADSADLVVGRPIIELIHLDDRDAYWDLHRRVCEGESGALEFRMVGLRGRARWMETNSTPLRDATGAITAVLSVTRDISDKKRALLQLKHREAMLRIAGQVARVGAWALEAEDRRIFWSAEACELFGYSVGKIPPLEEVIAHLLPESRTAFVAAVNRCLKLGESFDLEVVAQTVSGGVMHASCRGECSRDANGCIVRAHGAIQDITDRIKRTRALKENEERLRFVAQATVDTIWDWDLASDKVWWNSTFYSMFGHEPEEVEDDSTSWTTRIHPDDREQTIREIHATIDGEDDVWEHSYRFRRKDGSYAFVIDRGFVIRDESGRALRMVGGMTDVTEQRLAEEEIQQKEDLLRIGGKLARVGGWAVMLPGHEVFWSDEMYEILEIPVGQMPSVLEVLGLYTPESLQRLNEAMKRCVATGEPFDEEQQIHTATGRLLTVRTRGEAERDASGAVVCVKGAFQDVTDQKEAERMIREKDALMRIAGKLARVGGWAVTLCNGNQEKLFWSDEMYEILEFPPSDSPPALDGLGLYTPASFEALSSAMDECTTHGTPFDVELQMHTAAGRILTVRIRGEAERDASGAVVRVQGAFQDVTEQRRIEREGRRVADRLTMTLQNMSDAFMLIDRELKFVFVNQEAERVLQRKCADLIGKGMWDEFPEGRSTRAYKEYDTALKTNKPASFRMEYKPLKHWLAIDVFPSEEGLAIYFRVITDQIAMEQQLQQAQRLESVGQLTGGVAHDFNNLLTVIMGNAELLIDEIPATDDRRQLAETIYTAAQGGADLTHRLLAFARRQPLDPKPVDASELIRRMHRLLRRSLGEHIEMEYRHGGDLWKALVDPSQLENALLNLCLNARDAMQDGGRLIIETANTRIDQDYADQNVDVEPGQYVLISVRDTGEGIKPEELTRVFEPFFTTKETGKGTGLGLSMVYGFVKQSRGHIKIYSEPGHGTTVTMYLPRITQELEMPSDLVHATDLSKGSESILLAEDDVLVRQYASSQLSALGYKVFEAGTGPQALSVLGEVGQVELLFTDVIMPGGMNGRQLAEAAREMVPNLKVLYTSGYSNEVIVHQGRLDEGAQLLSKPYGRAQLARKVREVLDEKA